MDSIKEMLESIIAASKPKTQAFDTTATVTRVENGIAWVHIPGGVRETPVNLTISAQAGDTVQVRVSEGRAFLVGNASAPPTDDHVANEAVQSVKSTNKVVTMVKDLAERAAKIAGNTNQYFWHTESGTDTGAHITEIPQEEFLADPENGGGNLLARSNGVAVRDGLQELAVFGTETAIYTKSGTELAHFGYASGSSESGTAVRPYYTLGRRNATAEEYDDTMQYQKGDLTVYDGVLYVCRVNMLIGEEFDRNNWLRADNGNWSMVEGADNVAGGSASHAEGNRTIAAGTDSHAEGYKTMAFGSSSHAEGGTTIAQGGGAHAEGVDTLSDGYASHAEGQLTCAGNNYAHAEGYKTTSTGTASHSEGSSTNANTYAAHAEGWGTSAQGNGSHSEGSDTEASEYASHAEGYNTQAIGIASHAEGNRTIAQGYASHAGGLGTKATAVGQTVVGSYNELTDGDAGSDIFIVGGGSSDTDRSNAFSVGSDGSMKVKSKSVAFPQYLGTTSNGSYVLPFEKGRYLIVTSNNSTAALNGIWIVRLTNNSVWKMAGGGNVTITASSNSTISVQTTSGSVTVDCIYLGN